MWHVMLTQVWSSLQNRETQHVNIVLQYICINFLNTQIWKEMMLELNGNPTSDLFIKHQKHFPIPLKFSAPI
jgi:hypothetical protein